MRIPRNKDELYGLLWEDYLECKKPADGKSYDRESVKKSFIYKYYREKKKREADKLAESREDFDRYRQKSRQDKYILLRAARRLMKNGGLTEKEYGEVFRETVKKENGGKHFLSLLDGDPDAAYNELAYKLLCGGIQDMFGKKGYRLPEYDEVTREYVKPARKAPDEGKEGYTDEIALLHGFSVYLGSREGGVDSVSSDEITPEYIEECERLYSFLQTAKDAGGVLFPLYIHRLSLAGLYIIGERNFGEKDSKKCRICFTYLDDFCVYEDIMSLDSKITTFESVREAFDYLKSFTENGSEENIYDIFRDCNCEIPSVLLERKVGREFLRYLVSDADRSYRSKLEKERLASIRKQENEFRKSVEKVEKAKQK